MVSWKKSPWTLNLWPPHAYSNKNLDSIQEHSGFYLFTFRKWGGLWDKGDYFPLLQRSYISDSLHMPWASETAEHAERCQEMSGAKRWALLKLFWVKGCGAHCLGWKREGVEPPSCSPLMSYRPPRIQLHFRLLGWAELVRGSCEPSQ